MCVDSSQTIGSLVGFKNKLVLRNGNGEERMVLLLEGPVSYQKNGHHMIV